MNNWDGNHSSMYFRNYIMDGDQQTSTGQWQNIYLSFQLCIFESNYPLRAFGAHKFKHVQVHGILKSDLMYVKLNVQ